jgi:hypothetical protein
LLSGSYLLGTDARADRGAKATFTLVAGELGVCPLARRTERLALFVCLGMEVGQVTVHSTGFDTLRPDENRLTLAPSVDLRGSVQLVGPLRFALGLSMLAPQSRDTFVFDQPGGSQVRLFQASPVAGRAAAGLGLSF